MPVEIHKRLLIDCEQILNIRPMRKLQFGTEIISCTPTKAITVFVVVVDGAWCSCLPRCGNSCGDKDSVWLEFVLFVGIFHWWCSITNDPMNAFCNHFVIWFDIFQFYECNAYDSSHGNNLNWLEIVSCKCLIEKNRKYIIAQPLVLWTCDACEYCYRLYVCAW